MQNTKLVTHLVTSFYVLHNRLTLKGEAGAELVAGLVQLLGIKGAANAKGQTAVHLGVVCEGCNAEVVDLGLLLVRNAHPNHT
jgi:hypothetical protein